MRKTLYQWHSRTKHEINSWWFWTWTYSAWHQASVQQKEAMMMEGGMTQVNVYLSPCNFLQAFLILPAKKSKVNTKCVQQNHRVASNYHIIVYGRASTTQYRLMESVLLLTSSSMTLKNANKSTESWSYFQSWVEWPWQNIDQALNQSESKHAAAQETSCMCLVYLYLYLG